MKYEKKVTEMSRDNEVVLERCNALIKSITQPALVTKYNQLDSTQKTGKDNKFNYLDKNDKSNKLNTAPEAYKKNCKDVSTLVLDSASSSSQEKALVATSPAATLGKVLLEKTQLK